MGYAALLAETGRVNDFLNAGSILSWDARTMMPARGAPTRAKQLSTLAVAARDLLCSDTMRRALDAAEAEVASLPADSVEHAMTTQVREAVEWHSRIPSDLIRAKTELGAEAHGIWADARARADFASFAPTLTRMVEINRQMAEAIGYSSHPYDALMHRFEPGATTAGLRDLFATLRARMQPLVTAIAGAAQPRMDFLTRPFPADLQMDFARRMAAVVGYDFDRGRLDTTVHPFEISFTRNDVRITTRVSETWMPMCLFGALHEAGHGIYEQNVDPAYTRTPLATDLLGLYAVGGVSFGAHESQSRLWENHVGRSAAFWSNHYGALRDTFPDQLSDVSEEEFHRAINRSAPSLIRVEADELTYDFHIMLRVELEARMMEGSLQVADLPEAWNATIRETLGVDVPDDAHGVLQDVHWSSGQIGTFCNYTVGNIMAAQLFATASRDAAIPAALAAGDHAPLRDWLTENVCRHGRRYSRDTLLEAATGRALDPAPYLDYLEMKYTALYGLN